jgi:hypothetical protein
MAEEDLRYRETGAKMMLRHRRNWSDAPTNQGIPWLARDHQLLESIFPQSLLKELSLPIH